MITAQVLRLALLGSEWVLWSLLGLSVLSVYVMLERGIAFRAAGRGLPDLAVRTAREEGFDAVAPVLAQERLRLERGLPPTAKEGIGS